MALQQLDDTPVNHALLAVKWAIFHLLATPPDVDAAKAELRQAERMMEAGE